MTDLTFLIELINPIILGICLAVGFVLKYTFESFPNRFIPLIAFCLGTALAIIVNFNTGITLEVILGGMMSGLASTGMYEMLRNIINGGN